jgi:hypothetical protein
MKSTSNFPGLLEGFFTQRLLQQKQTSTPTIASYRDTFRLLFRFTEKHLHKAPSRLTLEEIDAPLTRLTPANSPNGYASMNSSRSTTARVACAVSAAWF